MVILHRAVNGYSAQRVHFSLENPWVAEQAVQQFGRSHRANQWSSPIYFLPKVSDRPAELRMSSTIASRLRYMGANTSGDDRYRQRNLLLIGHTELEQFRARARQLPGFGSCSSPLQVGRKPWAMIVTGTGAHRFENRVLSC